MESYQIDGWLNLPKDLARAVFKVEAKGDPANDARLAKLDKKEVELEQEHMMQVLLAERFKLKVHWATKEGDVYNLVVVKAVRLQSTGAPPSAEELKNWGDHPISPLYQHGSSDHGFEYTAHGASVRSTRSIRTISLGSAHRATGRKAFPRGWFRLSPCAEAEAHAMHRHRRARRRLFSFPKLTTARVVLTAL